MLRCQMLLGASKVIWYTVRIRKVWIGSGHAEEQKRSRVVINYVLRDVHAKLQYNSYA